MWVSVDENLSRLIGDIYESVYDRDAWRAVIQKVMARTRSRIAMLSLVDFEARTLDKFEIFAPETTPVDLGTIEYGQEQKTCDFSLHWSTKNPDAGFCDSLKVCSSTEYLQDPYIRWNQARFGTSFWQVYYSQPLDRLAFALSLHRTLDEGPASDQDTAVHKLIYDHLGRAMRLASRPPDFNHRTDALIALDGAGRIVAMSNAAAELISRADGISSERGFLSMYGLEAQRWLSDVIQSRSETAIGLQVGGGVQVPRPSGRKPHFALITRLPRSVSYLPVPTAEHVLRIFYVDAQSDFPLSIAKALRITPAERGVGELMMRGHSLESLSEKLGISRNTARVHLRSLFQKTGTNRQVDLVRLLIELTRW
jgi:DNA-binding CsgD family transcriptional regulator